MIPQQDLDHVLQKTQSIWPCFNGATIFITGAGGFVGTWLAGTLLHANRQLNLRARLVLLLRHPSSCLAESSDCAILQGDLNRPLALPAGPVDYVVHAAHDHQAADVETNLQGLRQIAAFTNRVRARRLLFLSSGAVYGAQPSALTHLPEEFSGEVDPANLYAQTKKRCEHFLFNAAQDALPIAIARLFAFAGPGLPLDLNFAVGNFVRDALAGGPIRIAGDGVPIRSYLYAADLAVWLWTILAKGQNARAYNVGSDVPVSILELARLVERASGSRNGIRIAHQPTPGAPPERYVPSIARARAELSLQPWIGLEESIARMCRWCGKNFQASTK